MNYLVSPILYKGAGINDITNGLLSYALNNNIQLKSAPMTFGEIKTYGIDNPKEYAQDCLLKLSYLIENLNHGDKVIFIDVFALGIDVVEYYLKRIDINVTKIGLLHGSTMIDGDLYENENWLRNFELGWFEIFDVIVSPSQYFVRYIPIQYRHKIVVHPWGLIPEIKPQLENKSIDVVFPHRFSFDKGIEDFLIIAKELPSVRFVITGLDDNPFEILPYNLRSVYNQFLTLKNVEIRKMEDNDDHIKTLKSSKIVLSTAVQEGFGYSVFKSIQCGNIPVLPHRCCYPEFFNERFLYKSIEEAVNLIKNMLAQYPKNYEYPNLAAFDFGNIIKLLN